MKSDVPQTFDLPRKAEPEWKHLTKWAVRRRDIVAKLKWRDSVMFATIIGLGAAIAGQSYVLLKVYNNQEVMVYETYKTMGGKTVVELLDNKYTIDTGSVVEFGKNWIYDTRMYSIDQVVNDSSKVEATSVIFPLYGKAFTKWYEASVPDKDCTRSLNPTGISSSQASSFHDTEYGKEITITYKWKEQAYCNYDLVSDQAMLANVTFVIAPPNPDQIAINPSGRWVKGFDINIDKSGS